MGCGTSSNDVKSKDQIRLEHLSINLNYSKVNSIFQKIQKIKSDLNRFEQPVLYIFGLEEINSHEQIISFDTRSKNFSQIMPPTGLQILLYQQLTWLTDEAIVISGGSNKGFTNISKRAQIWNPVSNIVITDLPDMINSRCQHIQLLYQGRIYVFGGRSLESQDLNLRTESEYFEFRTQKWVSLPNMPRARVNALSLVYQQKIYVCSGLTGKYKYSRKIDALNLQSNLWNTLDLRLNRGIEGCFACYYRTNEFVLFGGSTLTGATNFVHIYNLKNETIHSRYPMKSARSFQFGIQYQEQVLIIGGSEDYFIEICDLHNMKWEPGIKMPSYLSPQSCCNYGFSNVSLIVNDGLSERYIGKEFQNKIYLFGTDSEPQIIELNFDNGFSISKPVPLQMRLFSNQGGISLKNGKFYLFGGVRDSLDKVYSTTFIYNAITETASQCAKMKFEVYGMAYLLQYPWIYVCGGSQAGDGDNAIINRCQRYNIDENIWQEICPLNVKRVSSHLTLYFSQIFCWGGYVDNGERSQKIEFYDESFNKWNLIAWETPFALEGAAFFNSKPNEIMIFGGKENVGNVNKVRLLALTQSIGSKNRLEYVGSVANVGDIGVPRCLHKICRLKGFDDDVIIFGGPKSCPIDCFNIKENKISVNTKIEQLIQSFLKEIVKFQDSYMQNYLLLCGEI